MRPLLQDIRHGFRVLRKSPGFSAAAIVVLALGIGANTAIFSVVNAVLLEPLPFPEAERIVAVAHTPPPEQFPGMKTFSVSPANYIDWRSQADAFETIAAYAGGYVNLTGGGRPEAIPAMYVTSDYFSVLGATPLLGRAFAAGEDEPGRNRIVVLSEELWKTRFGGKPDAVGQTLDLNGQKYTVVGVLPARSGFPEWAKLWTPLAWTPEERAIRGIHDFAVLGRLKTGVPVEQAQAAMNALSVRLAQQYPADNKGWGAIVIPLREDLVGDVRPALLVLLGAVAFVLLIACANVANLVLAKTLGRRKEIAVRTALGASRRRVLQQMFSETLLLAVAGGALGLFLAGFGVKLIVAFLGDQLPRVNEVGVDPRVLVFTLVLSLVTGVLAGLAPAWRLTSANLNDALKQGLGRADSDAGGGKTRNALVVAEVALALVLMVGAGLMVRSLARLRNVDTGLDTKNVLTMTLAIPEEKYTTPEKQAAFYDQVLQRVRAIPGVEAAGVISSLPLFPGGSTQPVAIEGHPAAALSEQPEVAVRLISPGLVKTLGLRVTRGRDLLESDNATGPAVVLISESMARRFWPGEDAVGKRFTLSFVPGVVREVVGVVADAKLKGVRVQEPVAATYVPLAQQPRSGMNLAVRTASTPRSFSAAVGSAIHAVDPEQPMVDVSTMEERLGESLSHQRLTMLLLASFAGLALVLAGVGIYSVLSYSVRRRNREIGIRMALGADGADVVRMVVLQGMRPALLGLAIGIAGSLALGRALARLVYGVRATDPTTFVAVSVLLALVAAAACAVPAYRATRVEPTQALHEG
jgi:putative ABC transport system permease protein